MLVLNTNTDLSPRRGTSKSNGRGKSKNYESESQANIRGSEDKTITMGCTLCNLIGDIEYGFYQPEEKLDRNPEQPLKF